MNIKNTIRRNDDNHLFNQQAQDKKVLCTTEDLVRSSLLVGGSVEGAIDFLTKQGAEYDDIFKPVYDILNDMK